MGILVTIALVATWWWYLKIAADEEESCAFNLQTQETCHSAIKRIEDLELKVNLAISAFEYIKKHEFWGVQETCDKAIELLKQKPKQEL